MDTTQQFILIFLLLIIILIVVVRSDFTIEDFEELIIFSIKEVAKVIKEFIKKTIL